MNAFFMQEAIRLSLEKMDQGFGGPFGALVVQGDKIVGQGWNQVTTSQDPTAHAEIVAIRAACQHLGTFRLEGCEIYTSCEPCPMCLGAIYWARLSRLFYAADRKDAQSAGFDDDWIYREIALPLNQRRLAGQQLLRDQALAAFAAWQAKPDKIPY
jgi:guanine deaminase